MTHPRTPTAVDAVAEDYVAALTALSPMTATALGLPGADDRLDDFSPEGLARFAELDRQTLEGLAPLSAADDVDEVTLEAMRERLGVTLERYDAGVPHMTLNVLESPMQAVRDILDIMPTTSAPQWEVLAGRVAAIPAALGQWHESLLEARSRGLVAPRRQVLACIEQAHGFASDSGYFAALARDAGLPADPDAADTAGSAPAASHRTAPSDRPAAPLPEELQARLDRASALAREAYAATAQRLADDLLPAAPEADACGRDLYALHSRYFLGAEVDLAETYAWGQDELARITAEREEVARRIAGGGIPEAVAALDADPRYRLEGTAALREWMQERADEAVEAMAEVHVDIPDALRRIECRIAPTQTGGIYYTGPSDDLSRPGIMWWSVPPDVTTFSTWQELTTVYHEGVPGHHLQVGQAVVNSGRLNRWRRMLSWTSGHGEGWALYAERLMAELGFLEDLGNRLGMLDAQSLRAARVVIDMGVHCGFAAPASVGGGAWDYDKAWALLRATGGLPEPIARFELDRYLGWPGQAPSYKIGERLWLELRAECARRAGPDFDLREFHRRALDLGGVGLDTLRRAVLRDPVLPDTGSPVAGPASEAGPA